MTTLTTMEDKKSNKKLDLITMDTDAESSSAQQVEQAEQGGAVTQTQELEGGDDFVRMSMKTSSSASSHSSSIEGQNRWYFLDRTGVFALLIAFTGAGVTCAFLALGLVGAHRDQDLQFTRKASEVVLAVKDSWDDYTGAALWIHEACRSTADQSTTIVGTDLKICTREDFSELYQYLQANKDLNFQGMGFAPYVPHDERDAVQKEAFAYYGENYPEIQYLGFTGHEVLPGTNETILFLRSEQDYYIPAQYVEPVIPNKEFLGFDIMSMLTTARPEDVALMLHWQPVVTNRIDLAFELPQSSYDPGYYVLLMHPGIRLSGHTHEAPDSCSQIFIKVSAMIENALVGVLDGRDLSVFLFHVDTFESEDVNQFLGWGYCTKSKDGSFLNNRPYGPDAKLTLPPPNIAQRHSFAHHNVEDEPTLEDLQAQEGRCFYESIPIAQTRWTVVVCKESGYEPKIFYVVLGSLVILLATLFLALWFYTSQRKAAAIQKFQAEAEAEKAALIISSAEKTAAQERELNEYLSHEVRNPLAAAMSASSFVAATIQQERPLPTEEAVQACRGDVHIIQSSLKFINDLLRSLLDMQKAASNRLRLQIRPTDIYSDVLEPVRTILDSKQNPFEFLVDCPEHLVVMTDPLRLKQVVMNLASNSRKFVTQGFIKIGAHLNQDGNVVLFVSDSGPGVPADKRDKLFARYQDSLDSLSQGTGLGLSLSKQIMDLLKGELYLEENFDSGVPSFPGSRFVLNLKCKPEAVDDAVGKKHQKSSTERSGSSRSISKNDESNPRLPADLTVLIVDDDMILRRLISRSLKRVAPSWELHQAANGETALKMAAETDFDLIFLDQYMASIEKQLLGTETAHAMRAQGVRSIICGLSANQIEDSFLKAGANAFIQKPFPCEKEALTEEVVRVLDSSSMRHI